VEAEVANRLIELNRQFYQTFAGPFAQTRRRLQPGVKRALENLPLEARILDLGCGNGELWRSLEAMGYHGQYVGVDFSAGLLQIASESRSATLGRNVPPAVFLQADLSSPDWDRGLPDAGFDLVLAFAVLHHLPGHSLRGQVAAKARQRLAADGRFIFSVWQFLSQKRFLERIQPWEVIGLSSSQVDAGDYLLDWRQGGYGLRYVHHFEGAELEDLAAECGFRHVDEFWSDGREGRLSRYQTWVQPQERL
jgi:SAM-dependent methyltransferase